MAYLDSNGLETQISYIKGYVQEEIQQHASIPDAHQSSGTVSVFDDDGKLVFPDGTKVWIE